MNIYKSAAGATLIESRYRDALGKWPVANLQMHVPTREGDTFVVACGEKHRPPLVLFHGSMSNSIMWIKDVEAWSRHFRVYAIDLIGEPGLSAPSRPAIGASAYAAWLDDVLDQLNVREAALVGISLGAWLALDYAIRRPQRVRKMALMCPAGVGKQRASFYLKLIPLMLLGKWGRQKSRSIVFGSSLTEASERLQRLVDYLALIQTHFRPRMDQFPLFTDAELQSLTMPVLTIVGGRDVMIDSLQTKARMDAHLPNGRTLLLENQGHMLMDQTAVIESFLLTDN